MENHQQIFKVQALIASLRLTHPDSGHDCSDKAPCSTRHHQPIKLILFYFGRGLTFFIHRLESRHLTNIKPPPVPLLSFLLLGDHEFAPTHAHVQPQLPLRKSSPSMYSFHLGHDREASVLLPLHAAVLLVFIYSSARSILSFKAPQHLKSETAFEWRSRKICLHLKTTSQFFFPTEEKLETVIKGEEESVHFFGKHARVCEKKQTIFHKKEGGGCS